MNFNTQLLQRFLFCLLLIVPSVLFAQVRLPHLVADSMVLQRNSKLKIWGWASKGEKVKISFNGKTHNTQAGADGKWMVWLPPLKAGGPHEMSIMGTNKIVLKNILVGDVWMCSGQSNMVHYLELHKERYAKEVASANYPQIRQFLVPTESNLNGPAEDFPKGEWKAALPNNIGRFSVVAYFFAKALHERYQVPIGIINASVGGTPIEAWMSESGLKEFPDHSKTIEINRDTAHVNNIIRVAAAEVRERNKMRSEDAGLVGEKKWYDRSYTPKHWRTIHVPGYWEDQGVRDLDGVVWYRREINVPESMTGLDAKIALGRIVDADFLYVNGSLVGNTTYMYPQRRYKVPAGVLKPGKNILVVRVLNNGGKGGFVPDKPYHLTANGDTIDLKGDWQYKVGEVYLKYDKPIWGFSAQNQPTALFNAMIAPAINYAIKGVVWYQGESNATRAATYSQLLQGLIADWRKLWSQKDLPFLYAQLPNFGDMVYTPGESDWALLREAQLEALQVDNTGMAVTIDLGEWNDIHPGNKKPIGDRLALAARHIAYGEKDLVYSGPQYASAQIEDNKILISFTHVGGGLIAIDDEPLSQFTIAGKDKKFVVANAKIENNTVVVWHDRVKEPLYVRYAWSDNPDGANLYNKEGLPASPFRTDE